MKRKITQAFHQNAISPTNFQVNLDLLTQNSMVESKKEHMLTLSKLIKKHVSVLHLEIDSIKSIESEFQEYANDLSTICDTSKQTVMCLRNATACHARLAELYIKMSDTEEKNFSKEMITFVEDNLNSTIKRKREFDKISMDYDASIAKVKGLKKGLKGNTKDKDNIEQLVFNKEQYEASEKIILDFVGQANSKSDSFIISRTVEYMETLATFFKEGHILMSEFAPIINRHREYLKTQNQLNSQQMFGKSIQVICEQEGRRVPSFIVACSNLLIQNSQVEGLFRVSPTRDELIELRNYVNQTHKYPFEGISPHLVAGLLKLFLRELAHPLIAKEICSDLTEIDQATQKKNVKASLDTLSVHHFKSLQHIVKLCVQLDKSSQVNRMNNSNLSKVLSPNLIRSVSDDLAYIQDMDRINSLFLLLLDDYSFFFPTDDLELDDLDPDMLTSSVDLLNMSFFKNQQAKTLGIQKPNPIYQRTSSANLNANRIGERSVKVDETMGGTLGRSPKMSQRQGLLHRQFFSNSKLPSPLTMSSQRSLEIDSLGSELAGCCQISTSEELDRSDEFSISDSMVRSTSHDTSFSPSSNSQDGSSVQDVNSGSKNKMQKASTLQKVGKAFKSRFSRTSNEEQSNLAATKDMHLGISSDERQHHEIQSLVPIQSTDNTNYLKPSLVIRGMKANDIIGEGMASIAKDPLGEEISKKIMRPVRTTSLQEQHVVEAIPSQFKSLPSNQPFMESIKELEPLLSKPTKAIISNLSETIYLLIIPGMDIASSPILMMFQQLKDNIQLFFSNFNQLAAMTFVPEQSLKQFHLYFINSIAPIMTIIQDLKLSLSPSGESNELLRKTILEFVGNFKSLIRECCIRKCKKSYLIGMNSIRVMAKQLSQIVFVITESHMKTEINFEELNQEKQIIFQMAILYVITSQDVSAVMETCHNVRNIVVLTEDIESMYQNALNEPDSLNLLQKVKALANTLVKIKFVEAKLQPIEVQTTVLSDLVLSIRNQFEGLQSGSLEGFDAKWASAIPRYKCIVEVILNEADKWIKEMKKEESDPKFSVLNLLQLIRNAVLLTIRASNSDVLQHGKNRLMVTTIENVIILLTQLLQLEANEIALGKESDVFVLLFSKLLALIHFRMFEF